MTLVLQIIATLATVVIGAAASTLAYQQYKLSKAKLRFDLYDRRVEFFKTVGQYLAEMANASGEGLAVMHRAGQFMKDTMEVRFLFEQDVSDYVQKAYDQGIALSKLRLEAERPNLTDAENRRIQKEMGDLHIWFFEQCNDVFRVFGKDMSIKALR